MLELQVTITPEDFRNATCYSSSQNCPLVQALRRSVSTNSSAGPCTAFVNKEVYNIPTDQWGLNGYDANQIDELIQQAKISLEGIPTVTLTLTRITK